MESVVVVGSGVETVRSKGVEVPLLAEAVAAAVLVVVVGVVAVAVASSSSAADAAGSVLGVVAIWGFSKVSWSVAIGF